MQSIALYFSNSTHIHMISSSMHTENAVFSLKSIFGKKKVGANRHWLMAVSLLIYHFYIIVLQLFFDTFSFFLIDSFPLPAPFFLNFEDLLSLRCLFLIVDSNQVMHYSQKLKVTNWHQRLMSPPSHHQSLICSWPVF